MNKENLIIIAGMPRAGTSYMYQVLAKHPQVFLPIIKETNFFIYNQSKGINWFKSLYTNAKDDQKLFDISPFYFLDNTFFNNAKNFDENQKVILLLRDPNEWVKSFYNQLKKQTYNLPEFNTFIEGYELSFENNKFFINFKDFDFIENVEKFKKAFKDNLLLIDFNYFQNNKVETLNEIEKFIGIDKYFNDNNIIKDKINAGSVKNNKFIAYLSTIDVLRNIAFKILPENVIHYIRNKYILGITVENTKKEELKNIYSNKNIFEITYFNKTPIVKC